MEAVSVKESERTCVGCRQKGEPSALLRLAVSDAPPWVAPDVGHRGGHERGGRGVWVHANVACVRAATDRGGLARSLKKSVDVDAGALLSAAREAYRRRIEGLLLAASRKRALTVGTDGTREALSSGRLNALVVAEDAAGRRDEIVEGAARLGCHALVFSTKSSLGRLFGRDEVGVIGILERGIAAELIESGQRLLDLSEAE